MFINNAGGKMLTSSIYHFSATCIEIFTDRTDLATLDQHVSILQRALCFVSPNSSIFYKKVFLLWWFGPSISIKWIHYCCISNNFLLIFFCGVWLFNIGRDVLHAPDQRLTYCVITNARPYFIVDQTTEA